MSKLAEIESAVEKLSAAEQQSLLQFITEQIHRSGSLAEDPVAGVIGAYSSVEPTDTGRRAEEILYGRDEAE